VAPCLIDGTFPSLLLVRDLASRVTLLALPCRDQSAATVAASLALLFERHGPPLVVKSDNGSPFIARGVADVLTRGVVTHLRSPVYTPRYNGSVESTGGCLKARAAHIAGCSGGGRCGCWSSDDIEAARLAANAFNRPWGVRGPTPDQRWDARPPITPDHRALFVQAVDRFRESIRRSWLGKHLACNPGASVAPDHFPAGPRSSVDRAAIRSALVELGELTIGRPANTSTHSAPEMRRD
jgi:transposase InsO family protein